MVGLFDNAVDSGKSGKSSVGELNGKYDPKIGKIKPSGRHEILLTFYFY